MLLTVEGGDCSELHIQELSSETLSFSFISSFSSISNMKRVSGQLVGEEQAASGYG